VECVKQMKTTKENLDFYPKEVIRSLMKINTSTIKALMDSIKKIENEIDEIIKANEKINQQIKLITSIPGVGLNTALYLVLVTNQFENFKEWRKMACYAGVAPFEYSSGTSIRGRNKVNHLADKKLKSLLYMCAIGSIKYNKEIKEYFDKKKSEGKHSMLIINNIKCKLLARVFAVVNRDQPYIEIHKWAA
jgi:transposase